MAKIWQISDGRSYIVNGDPGTTITYTNSTSNGTAAGKQAASIPAGATSVTFPSNGAEVEISSDTATIDQVFNAAAAGSGSSSGGSGSAGGVTFQVVTTLPDQGAAGVIYLVKVSETGDDKFEEWIWVDSAWESIGTTAVDPTTYAKLIGGNTFEGNQVINGDLTVTGDVSGVSESTYNVVETAETTITPTGGTWVRYTGSETALTIEEPGWDGEAEISYIETATPVDLQGVTWSPAKPILTGNGPFVYTLVHAGPGQILAGAYGYSTPTAEAVRAVVPMAWSEYTTAPTGANFERVLAIGNGAKGGNRDSLVVGEGAKTTGWNSVAVGGGATASPNGTALGAGCSAGSGSVGIGQYHATNGSYSVGIGSGVRSVGDYAVSVGQSSSALTQSVAVGSMAKSSAVTSVTIGSNFAETVDGTNVTHTCTTEGTGSITIGAGANTLNNGDTESSNSITIGCKAKNQGYDNIVIGAQAESVWPNTVVIGPGAKATHVSGAAIGKSAIAGRGSVAIGELSVTGTNTVSVGVLSTSAGTYSTAVGCAANSQGQQSLALGGQAKSAGQNSVAVGYQAQASNLGSIAIGSGATITDTTNTDNTVTPSENTTVIGYGATASAPNVVVLGAGASASASKQIAIGASAKPIGSGSLAIGANSTSNYNSVVIGESASAGEVNQVSIGVSASGGAGVAIGKGAVNNLGGTAIGWGTIASTCGTSIGIGAKSADTGAVVFLSRNTYYDDATLVRTQLYFSGANTPLANQYYNGEAMMGYTVTDNAGTVLACGTRRLSELFTDNTLNQAATIDEETGDYVMPTVFHPSDLDLPVEEPTEEPSEPEDITITIPEPIIPEPEEYTPLPVYPIVEPEDTTNIPESEQEPYTPLPVYPIVEPEVPEIPTE